jgi:hypothetical protein
MQPIETHGISFVSVRASCSEGQLCVVLQAREHSRFFHDTLRRVLMLLYSTRGAGLLSVHGNVQCLMSFHKRAAHVICLEFNCPHSKSASLSVCVSTTSSNRAALTAALMESFSAERNSGIAGFDSQAVCEEEFLVRAARFTGDATSLTVYALTLSESPANLVEKSLMSALRVALRSETRHKADLWPTEKQLQQRKLAAEVRPLIPRVAESLSKIAMLSNNAEFMQRMLSAFAVSHVDEIRDQIEAALSRALAAATGAQAPTAWPNLENIDSLPQLDPQ